MVCQGHLPRHEQLAAADQIQLCHCLAMNGRQEILS
jgi:hypothetical protein